jgi:hypothetical protein
VGGASIGSSQIALERTLIVTVITTMESGEMVSLTGKALIHTPVARSTQGSGGGINPTASVRISIATVMNILGSLERARDMATEF